MINKKIQSLIKFDKSYIKMLSTSLLLSCQKISKPFKQGEEKDIRTYKADSVMGNDKAHTGTVQIYLTLDVFL